MIKRYRFCEIHDTYVLYKGIRYDIESYENDVYYVVRDDMKYILITYDFGYISEVYNDIKVSNVYVNGRYIEVYFHESSFKYIFMRYVSGSAFIIPLCSKFRDENIYYFNDELYLTYKGVSRNVCSYIISIFKVKVHKNFLYLYKKGKTYVYTLSLQLVDICKCEMIPYGDYIYINDVIFHIAKHIDYLAYTGERYVFEFTNSVIRVRNSYSFLIKSI